MSLFTIVSRASVPAYDVAVVGAVDRSERNLYPHASAVQPNTILPTSYIIEAIVLPVDDTESSIETTGISILSVRDVYHQQVTSSNVIGTAPMPRFVFGNELDNQAVIPERRRIGANRGNDFQRYLEEHGWKMIVFAIGIAVGALIIYIPKT
jgi:hypothetical protein